MRCCGKRIWKSAIRQVWKPALRLGNGSAGASPYRGLLKIGAAFLSVIISANARQPLIEVHADRVLHPIAPLLTGVCIEDVNHEIYGGLYSQMIYGESFQEPAPPGRIQGFKAFGGDWAVSNHVVRVHASGGPKLFCDSLIHDGVIAVELFFPDANAEYSGLIVRASHPGDGGDAFDGCEVSLDPRTQTLRLARHRHNYEPIKDVPCAVPLRSWIKLKVDMHGSVLEISVNGKSILRHDDEGHALEPGGFGLRPWSGTVMYRDLKAGEGTSAASIPFTQLATPQVSGMWDAVESGTARGKFEIKPSSLFSSTAQFVEFHSGKGRVGIANSGLNRWGMSFEAGKPYEGYFYARADADTELTAALESKSGSPIYAETPLKLKAGDWQRLDFVLTPDATDPAGRFTVTLKKSKSSVTLGHAFLQPGDWGRFKGLPVRRDVADGLIKLGTKVVRYGGSMVNTNSYRWKNMIGPRAQRPPYSGLWHPYSSDGWGIVDFLNFAEAAGFEYIPDFNISEKPSDMGDFVDYAKGSANSEWARHRADDGHPEPYRLRYMELGNEERVDMEYAEKFEALASAIWAKDKNMILVVGDFAYTRKIEDPFHFTGADSHLTTLAGQQRILKFAKEHDGEVWFDIHVNTEQPWSRNNTMEGMFSYCDALDKLADGAKHKVVVFELNAGNHAQRRALANAQAIMAIERDGRLPIVTSANGLQPDGQNDNDWDQGLLFLNPSKVWAQPPGFVMQMLSDNYQPELVQCDVSGANSGFEAVATRSENGETLVLQVLNATADTIQSGVHLQGISSQKPIARVTRIFGDLGAVNTASEPSHIDPEYTPWSTDDFTADGKITFPPNSFTIVRYDEKP